MNKDKPIKYPPCKTNHELCITGRRIKSICVETGRIALYLQVLCNKCGCSTDYLDLPANFDHEELSKKFTKEMHDLTLQR